MFDRLSSLVIALTLVVIAAIFAALTGGDPLSIALMAVAGFVAAGTVYSALPVSLPDAQGAAPVAEAPPVSLLRHPDFARWVDQERSDEHTSELQSLMRISYAVFCLKKQK